MAMQRQKGIKTNEPFEPKNVEDNMKKGGKVMEKAKMKHDDEAQDKKLISKMIKASEKKEMPGMKKGGKAVKKMAKGGVTSSQEKSMGRNMARAMNQKSTSRGR